MIKEVEYIICSAIWYQDLPIMKDVPISHRNPTNIDFGVVFCGHRHVHCAYTMIAVTGKRAVVPEVGNYIQGFITNKNRFVDRKEAMIIAKNAKQVNEEKLYNSTNLFSEDLY